MVRQLGGGGVGLVEEGTLDAAEPCAQIRSSSVCSDAEEVTHNSQVFVVVVVVLMNSFVCTSS